MYTAATATTAVLRMLNFFFEKSAIFLPIRSCGFGTRYQTLNILIIHKSTGNVNKYFSCEKSSFWLMDDGP
jgi:hypothetical protein